MKIISKIFILILLFVTLNSCGIIKEVKRGEVEGIGFIYPDNKFKYNKTNFEPIAGGQYTLYEGYPEDLIVEYDEDLELKSSISSYGKNLDKNETVLYFEFFIPRQKTETCSPQWCEPKYKEFQNQYIFKTENIYIEKFNKKIYPIETLLNNKKLSQTEINLNETNKVNQRIFKNCYYKNLIDCPILLDENAVLITKKFPINYFKLNDTFLVIDGLYKNGKKMKPIKAKMKYSKGKYKVVYYGIN